MVQTVLEGLAIHITQERCISNKMSQENTLDFMAKNYNISNEDLYRRTNTAPLTVETKRRRWGWLGHIKRMAPKAIPKVAMRWTPAGKRKRGRPKMTWPRSVEKEMTEAG